MMLAPITFCARLMMLFAVLAMSATGFAHSFSDDRTSPEMLAYLSMGGTLAELCGETDPAHAFANHCDACLIGDDTLFPEPSPTGFIPALRTRPQLFGARNDLWIADPVRGVHLARAPPCRVIA